MKARVIEVEYKNGEIESVDYCNVSMTTYYDLQCGGKIARRNLLNQLKEHIYDGEIKDVKIVALEVKGEPTIYVDLENY